MPGQKNSIVTIGNFDGVHAGHRAILQAARQLGDHRCLPVVAMTFARHPATVLRSGTTPLALTDLSQKTDMLLAAGADEVVVLEPTADLLSLGPKRFLEQMVDRHRPAVVVEGSDFRFGRDRAGDVATLRSFGGPLGFELHVVDPVEVSLCDQTLTTVSSSLVRWLLACGRVDDAARCLGQPYALTGRVIGGDRRGRSIGFPTANLDPEAVRGRAVPGDGVYAGVVQRNGQTSHAAAISVGCQSTFGGGDRVVEAHLVGFDGDLYDQAVAFCFSRWLRDQRPFPNSDVLQRQLKRDVCQTRQWQLMGLIDVRPNHDQDRATA